MSDTTFFTEIEAAEFCRCSRWTLKAWRNREVNPVPHQRVGGKILYEKTELTEWIRSHKQRKEVDA